MERDSQRLAFAAGAAGTVRDFYSLPRAVQDRFIAATRGASSPLPILKKRASRTRVLAWLAAGVVLAPLPFVLSRLGFGDVTSPLALQRTPLLAVYAGLFAASLLAIFRAFVMLAAARRLPFAPGFYVFPACVVDARTFKLRVYRMADVHSVDRSAAGLLVTLPDGGRVDFSLGTEETEKALRDVAAAREAIKEGPSSARAMVVLDPLFDGAVASPLGPTAPLTRVVPVWSRVGWLAGVAIGSAFGLVLFVTRNTSSDAAMFQAAAADDDIAVYQQYVAQGGRRSAEVSDVLLPRVELREAEKAGTVDAMKAYVASHPGSKIPQDVAAAMRRAMLAALETAKRDGTVTALAAFAARYPDHGLGPELASARHSLYAAALGAYAKANPERDPALLKQMEKLLAFAEKNGPTAHVRFVVRSSKSMENADAQAEKSRFFGGPETLPTRYFDLSHIGPRADVIQKELVDKLAASFPADILAFQTGPAPTVDADPATLKVPTLLLEYTPEWSRSFGMSDKPRGIFAGVTMQIDGTLVIPGDPQPFKFRHTVWRGPEPWRLKKEMEGAALGAFETKVYAVMCDPIFESFQKKVLGVFFPQPSTTPKKT